MAAASNALWARERRKNQEQGFLIPPCVLVGEVTQWKTDNGLFCLGESSRCIPVCPGTDTNVPYVAAVFAGAAAAAAAAAAAGDGDDGRVGRRAILSLLVPPPPPAVSTNRDSEE